MAFICLVFSLKLAWKGEERRGVLGSRLRGEGEKSKVKGTFCGKLWAVDSTKPLQIQLGLTADVGRISSSACKL